MSKRKLEVVELNKKKNKILLTEEQSNFILFIRKHSVLIFLTSLILSLTVIGTSLFILIKNLNTSDNPNIKETSVDVSLTDYQAIIGGDSLTGDSAQDAFLNNDKFKHNGEVIAVKKVEKDQFTIIFYSDGTAVKISKNDKVTRINPLPDGRYGIDENGVFSSEAKISDVTIVDTKTYNWGTVQFLSDGSAIVSNSKMDVFVRNSTDVKDDYISNNKISYPKETKTVGDVKITYYTDGTIEVVKNNTSYIVRSESDLNITSNDVTFKNNNEATIYKTFDTTDGYHIKYYTDGGAIIIKNDEIMSVRKSNSIVIIDNKIYEIVDNIYVEVSNTKNGTTYYTNGGAVVNQYDGTTVYVSENSNIKYQGNSITTITEDYERISNETNISGENTKIFEHTAVIKTEDYTAIVPKEKVIYNTDGTVKEIEDVNIGTSKDFTITNNTNNKIKYRVAIEESKKTTVNTEYLRYQLISRGVYLPPKKLNESYWTDDNISDALNINGINYILVEDSLEPFETTSISVMLWTDYDTIPNSEQDKYFYGTIRVYAWEEVEK